MDDYIKREAAVGALDSLKPFLHSVAQERLMRRIIKHIANLPTADVVERSSFEAVGNKYVQIQDKLIRGEIAPVVHGRWEVYLGGKELMCSACTATFWDDDGNGGSNYCPNCGAKMDGKSNVPRTEG